MKEGGNGGTSEALWGQSRYLWGAMGPTLMGGRPSVLPPPSPPPVGPGAPVRPTEPLLRCGEPRRGGGGGAGIRTRNLLGAERPKPGFESEASVTITGNDPTKTPKPPPQPPPKDPPPETQ